MSSILLTIDKICELIRNGGFRGTAVAWQGGEAVALGPKATALEEVAARSGQQQPPLEQLKKVTLKQE